MKNEFRREETKTAIIEAAAICFAAAGYAETGVAEICRQAGVSKGAFYYHFDSKQTLFLRLVEAWLQNLEQMLEAVPTGENSTPQNLLEMARALQQAFRAESRQAAIIFELWKQSNRDERMRKSVISTFDKYGDKFNFLIRQGITEGSLAPVDAVSGSQAILSLAIGLFLQSLLYPEGGDWAMIAEESLAILLKGLERR